MRSEIHPSTFRLVGRKGWTPNGLVCWSYLAAICGAMNAAAMFAGGSGLTMYGFANILVGVGWMIAAGIVPVRRNGLEAESG